MTDELIEEGSPEPKNLPLALGVGAAVAVLGGGLWAFVVAAFKIELGLIAWVIGMVVGLAIIAVAKHGDMRLGVAAAGIAFGGVLIGKLLIAQFGLAYSAVDRIVDDREMLSEAVYHQMVEDDEVEPRVVSVLEEPEAHGTVDPDVLSQVMKVQVDATSRAENMSQAEKKQVAQAYADAVLADASFTERMGLSGWDLIWFGLAIYTAFRICVTNRHR